MTDDEKYIEIHAFLRDLYKDERNPYATYWCMMTLPFEGNEVAYKLKECGFGIGDKDYYAHDAFVRKFHENRSEEFVETALGRISDVVFDTNENYIVFVCEHGYVYDYGRVHFIGPDFERLGLV